MTRLITDPIAQNLLMDWCDVLAQMTGQEVRLLPVAVGRDESDDAFLTESKIANIIQRHTEAVYDIPAKSLLMAGSKMPLPDARRACSLLLTKYLPNINQRVVGNYIGSDASNACRAIGMAKWDYTHRPAFKRMVDEIERRVLFSLLNFKPL